MSWRRQGLGRGSREVPWRRQRVQTSIAKSSQRINAGVLRLLQEVATFGTDRSEDPSCHRPGNRWQPRYKRDISKHGRTTISFNRNLFCPQNQRSNGGEDVRPPSLERVVVVLVGPFTRHHAGRGEQIETNNPSTYHLFTEALQHDHQNMALKRKVGHFMQNSVLPWLLTIVSAASPRPGLYQ